VFITYYSKLTSILQVDLCPHFVTSNIITISDQDEIIKTATTSRKAAVIMLLNTISLPLGTGYTTSFYKMLEIIQQHGFDAAQHLAGEKLNHLKWRNQMVRTQVATIKKSEDINNQHLWDG